MSTLNLVTGLPGASKTLYTIKHVIDLVKGSDTQVYYNGIPDLKLPWIEFDDPTTWHTLPQGAVIVIDECQRMLRPRANGSRVPEYVSEFELHRHKGYRIYLITQHPSLIDLNVRRLVTRHYHIIRKWGTQASTIHEWASTKDNCDKSRKDSIQHHWLFDKSLYGVYKSSSEHNVKRTIPARLYALLGLIVLLFAAVWFAYHQLSGRLTQSATKTASAPAQQTAPLKRRAMPTSVPKTGWHCNNLVYKAYPIPRRPMTSSPTRNLSRHRKPVLKPPAKAVSVSLTKLRRFKWNKTFVIASSKTVCL